MSPKSGNGSRTAVKERVRLRVDHRHRPWYRRRWFRRTLAVAGLLFLAGVLDAVWVATVSERALRDARDSMQQGAAALSEGQVEQAGSHFLLARRDSEKMLGALRHPIGLLAGIVPGISDDVHAIRALGVATEYAAEAGQHLVRAAKVTGWNGSGTDVLQPGGRFRLDLVLAASHDLEAAARAMSEAEQVLAPTATMDLLRPVGAGAATARAQLGDSARIVRSTADLAQLLPPMLGVDGTRHYLLALQNPADPRGSGGLLGLYAILEARNGRLGLSELHHVGHLRAPAPVDAPKEDVRPYSIFGSLTDLKATTAPPDFPVAARLAMGVWEASGHKPVDGVMAVDPVALAYLIGATNPVATKAWPEPLTAENFVTVFEHDTFLLPQSESDRLQERLGQAAWDSVLRGKPSPVALTSALSRATAERHLQVYSQNPGEQELLDRLGASGRIEYGGNPLLLVWNGASASRSGYFAERSIDYDATIRQDGSADVVVKATLENTAPVDGPPSLLFGDATTGEPLGYFSAYVSVYLPLNAKAVRSPRVDGRMPLVCLPPCEQARVVTVLMGAPAGGRTMLEIAFHIPPMEVAGTFPIRVIPQPALRPALYSVRVTLPPGARVSAHSPGMTVEGSTVVWTAVPVESTELQINYDPAGS